LFVNPGGPGESGNQILPVIAGLLPAAIRRHFDIVSFDPRGTGASAPLRCGTSPSAVSSVLPVPAKAGQPLPGTGVFTAMARACQRRAAALEPFVSTTATARDMDRVRQALGVATISYYGLSYGTVLGSEYAALFPHRIKYMVLDGAVDVDASLSTQAIEQAPAIERSLDHLLATCAGSTCPLGAEPVSFFRSLARSLARSPLGDPGGADPFPVTVGDLDTATLFALSVPGFAPSYYSALVAARTGDGAPLRAMALELNTDLDGSPLVDAQWAITCNDARGHPGPLAAGSLARSLAHRYPLIGAYAVTYNLGGCVAWPAARQPVAPLRADGAPPILVIGTTGDPNTPLIGAEHLARALPGARLLTWHGWGHTWLLSGSGDHCMQTAVTGYLSGGVLPSRGDVCQ
jgi:pimeloyl-ACP methyl ester carboxylesterase